MGASAGRAPVSWHGVAYHADPDSENPIHQDRVARRLGFSSGLVPGATTYAMLVHPALVAWGESWLGTGQASITLQKPLYDGERISVKVSQQTGAGYQAELVDRQGTVRASAEVRREGPDDDPPVHRGAKPAPERPDRPQASPEVLERLQRQGLGACVVPWRGLPPHERYLENPEAMPRCVRIDQLAFANPAFTLNLANELLQANLALGPWIHVGSEVQHHARIALGRSVHVEGEILDLFEKNGHRMIDLSVHGFLSPDEPAVSIRHRAILQLRSAREEPS